MPDIFKNPKILAPIAAVGLGALTFGGHKVARKMEGEITDRKAIPTNFSVQERWMTIGTDFILKDSQGAFGVIEQKVISLTPSFTYFDGNGNLIAKAKQELVSWGVEINVYDANDTLLGSIEEKVFESLLKTSTSYTLKDASGSVVGESDKLQLFAVNFTIRDSEGDGVATISRDAFDLGKATWSVNVTADDDQLDERVYLFIPAYKTYIDNKRSDGE